ncbi:MULTISPECIES: Ig-like domain-containing protein [Mesorhizobium]|uniref:Ig-like domain-containing protein n=1 Tax=Mesorhizobium TaxID=68287 RepID=UPI001314384B|nr:MULTISPECIES: Ig-like domain-containing protein [Mesorhizobium]
MASIFKGKESVKLSGNTTATGEPTDFVIHGSPRDVMNYSRNGNDLTIQMNDGHVYHIQNYGGHGFDFNNLVFTDGANKVVVNLGPAVASVGDGILEGLIAETAMNASLSASALLGILGAAGGALGAVGAGGGGGSEDTKGNDTVILDAPTLSEVIDDVGTITGSVATGTVTNDTAPLITGTMPSTSTSDMTVEVMRDGAIIGTATVSGTSWTYQDGELVHGQTYIYSARVVNSTNGKSYGSNEISIIIDTEAPAATTLDHITDNVGRITGDIANNGLTNDTTPTLTGSLTAELATGEFVQILRDATVVGTATVTGTGWSFESAALTDGQTYSFTARVSDAAGNMSAETSARSITVDTTLPVTPSILQISNDPESDFTSSANTTIVSGRAGAHSTIEILIGSTSMGTLTVDSTGVWQSDAVDLSTLTTGQTLTVTVRSFDTAGNVSPDATQIITKSDEPLLSDIDTSIMPADSGLVIQGDEAGSQFGFSVSAAGDLNNDGIDDFIVGAPGTISYTGTTYIVFGSETGLGTVDGTGRTVLDVSTLTASQGFIINGNGVQEFLGNSVSAAGDVNGDGIDDIIFSAQGTTVGSNGMAGTSYVLFGTQSGFGTDDGNGHMVLNLGDILASQGFSIQGENTLQMLGGSVASAGDVNGDGIDDIIVGATRTVAGGAMTGSAYVVFGSTTGFGTDDGSGHAVLSIGDLNASTGFVIVGGGEDDKLGISVSSAGDINDDGYDDIIVGASENDEAGVNAGQSYVIYGSQAGFGVDDGSGHMTIDVSQLSASEGFVIKGTTAADTLGYSVSSAGDINGDGIADLIVGAYNNNDGGTSAGEAYVIFGTTAGFGVLTGGRMVVDTAVLSSSQGFVIQGSENSGNLGFSVSSAGDFNGDGINDLIVGASGEDEGAAYVIYGSSTGFGAEVSGRQVIDVSALTPETGFRIQGNESGDSLGISVSGAGDINSDGNADLIVGATNGSSTNGEAYIIYGVHHTDGRVAMGTNAADFMAGTDHSDNLTGAGGADVLLGYDGDDILTVADTDFARIDGGEGNDTLILSGSGLHLDLSSRASDVVTSVETIDITGSGANTLNVTANDVFNISSTTNQLVIDGDSNDTVEAYGFTNTGTQTINTHTYNVYTDGSATLVIDQDITNVLTVV